MTGSSASTRTRSSRSVFQCVLSVPGISLRSTSETLSATTYRKPGSRPLCFTLPKSSDVESSVGLCEKALATSGKGVTTPPAVSVVRTTGEPWYHGAL